MENCIAFETCKRQSDRGHTSKGQKMCTSTYIYVHQQGEMCTYMLKVYQQGEMDQDQIIPKKDELRTYRWTDKVFY